jgi:hypothetical protein
MRLRSFLLKNSLDSSSADEGWVVVVAVHHPPYSLDKTHGGYLDIAVALDQAMDSTGVIPHAVLSGHVHNMQRFTRRYKGREIPYVIDGRGGYANTDRLAHKLQKDANGDYPRVPVPTRSEQDLLRQDRHAHAHGNDGCFGRHRGVGVSRHR